MSHTQDLAQLNTMPAEVRLWVTLIRYAMLVPLLLVSFGFTYSKWFRSSHWFRQIW